MSTSSTVRHFGTAKTYSRTRGNNSGSSYDEKPAPLKASPAHTKWGKTNFVAIREDKKSKFETSQEKKETKPEDPFSFDTEDKRKAVASKTQRVVAAPEVQRSSGSTRLPASRIVTQGKRQIVTSAKDPSSEEIETAIARPGRTYTRSQEGRMNSGPSSQLILNQFIEVGKTVKTDFGIEVVYSVEPHEPKTKGQVPVAFGSASSASEKISKKFRADPAPPLPNVEASKPGKSSSVVDDDDDDDDIFPATFRRTPLKTYTGEIITPISNAPDDPPPKKRRKTTGLPRGRKPSLYSDPNLIEEYRKRYEETHGKKEPTAGMFNSTVVSSKELVGSQGTTLVVVCKPKVEVSEKKDDVQTKYFKNVKKELDKAGKNIEASETVLQDDAKTVSSTCAESSSTTPSPCLKKSSPASSQNSASSVSTPTRMLRVRFADEENSPATSTPSSQSANSPAKPPTRSVLTRSKDKQAVTGNQDSISSSANAKSINSNSCADKKEPGVATRTRSGGRQYRIFKSRGPPQPAPKEASKDQEKDTTEALAAEDGQDTTKPNSPPMPELTREVPEPAVNDDSLKKGQNPPNIIDEETERTADSSDVTQEEAVPVSVSESQVEQVSEDTSQSEKTVETAEESSANSSSQMITSDSQDVPSPAPSDDSQELSQETVSSTESSQKEDTALAAPRRFFKSKKSSSASNLQRKVLEKSPSKASYNARSWQWDEEHGDKDNEAGAPPAKQAKRVLPFSEKSETKTKVSKEPCLTRSVHWPKDKDQQAYTSVKVQKQHKELYTVVHNVKMAYEVQESGETQDFMDDVEYLLDNLKDTEPISIRALSTIQLAGKCISPAFRMHLRAHGTVTKIFSLLHDACSSPSLALSTASMMFMLSRDRLNMDLDKESLHLMLKLNEVDMPRNGDGPSETEQGTDTDDGNELEKWRTRVQELLVQLQKETNAKQIDLDFVSTGNLAMESLLSLTSRRAGEWFKEELRMLGGLDHFVESIHCCGSGMKGDLASNLDKYTPSLKKLDRCLRVLENITLLNSDNQTHVIEYKKGLLITATGRVLQQCVECLPTMPLQEVENEVSLKEQAGWIVFECLLAILRVMLNITHDSELGSTRIGDEESLLHTVLQCVVCTQWCVPPDQRFDLLVLSLGLLINLMEYSPANREHLVRSTLTGQIKDNDEPSEMNAVAALVQLFLQRETAAREMEEEPQTPVKANDTINKSGEWRESDSGIEWVANSAEKVKRTDEQQKETGTKDGAEPDKEGEKKEGEDADKSIDGASILEDEETFTKALHKAGKHMENSIVASYVGLLLGCLIRENKEYMEKVKEHLPDGSFESMIKILKKFLGFMNLTTAFGTTDANSIQRVIDTLEAC